MPRFTIEDLLQTNPVGSILNRPGQSLTGLGHGLLDEQLKGGLKVPTNQHKTWISKPTTPPLEIKPDAIIRERGASNVEILPEGEAEIHQIGKQLYEQLKNRPNLKVCIYTSPWSRSKDTAKILAEELRAFKPEVETISELGPQSLGQLEGQPSEAVKPIIDRLRTSDANVVPPSRSPLTGQAGESMDHYKRRVLPKIARMMKETSESNVLDIIADHSSGMKLIRSWVSAGAKPDFQLDTKYMKSSIDGLRVDGLMKTHAGRWVYRMNVIPRVEDMNIVLVRHGATEFQVSR